MRTRVTVPLCALTATLMASPAGGQEARTAFAEGPPLVRFDVEPSSEAEDSRTANAWRIEFGGDPPSSAPAPVLALPAVTPALAGAQETAPRPIAFEYSDAYRMRRKIHVYASVAMLPLFVTQYALGHSLYDRSSEDTRTAHAAVGASIGVLFGVNTVTGVWNLWEGRKDPTRRARRITHGVLMLGADAGFLATAMLAPGDGGGDRSTHRAVAITSMSVATASYLFMLFTR